MGALWVPGGREIIKSTSGQIQDGGRRPDWTAAIEVAMPRIVCLIVLTRVTKCGHKFNLLGNVSCMAKYVEYSVNYKKYTVYTSGGPECQYIFDIRLRYVI